MSKFCQNQWSKCRQCCAWCEVIMQKCFHRCSWRVTHINGTTHSFSKTPFNLWPISRWRLTRRVLTDFSMLPLSNQSNELKIYNSNWIGPDQKCVRVGGKYGTIYFESSVLIQFKVNALKGLLRYCQEWLKKHRYNLVTELRVFFLMSLWKTQ